MIGDSIGAAVGANKRLNEAKKESRRTRQAQERALAMATQANYTPDRISDHIGPYQRSTSPMAQAFLESFLSGSNPSAVQGVRAGAPALQQGAQQRFNQTYGGWDALQQKQRAMEQSTPWTVKPFEDPITNDMRAIAQNPLASQKYGLTPEQTAALKNAGITVNPANGKLESSDKWSRAELSWINDALKHGQTDALSRYATARGQDPSNRFVAEQMFSPNPRQRG